MTETESAARFAEWMAAVGAELERTCGLSPAALPDTDYSSMFADEMTPREAAHEVLRDEGFYDGGEGGE